MIDGLCGSPTTCISPLIHDEESAGPGDLSLPEEVSEQGLGFISQFEGLQGTMYNDPAGHCTIGYGHLVHYGNCNGDSSEEIFRNGVTLDEALDLLRADLKNVAEDLGLYVGVPLTQEQFDALVSLSMNVGFPELESTGFFTVLNQGDYQGAADQMLEYVFAHNAQGEVTYLHGLARRRELERNLFLFGQYGGY